MFTSKELNAQCQRVARASRASVDASLRQIREFQGGVTKLDVLNDKRAKRQIYEAEQAKYEQMEAANFANGQP
ncbi:MAG: hypothetical protein EPO08_00610 [Rhodospirillaceae bacterium]|nr:MAG: hypothetical protein EPO08_00610 [Rhodospirillaceae bacterium]